MIDDETSGREDAVRLRENMAESPDFLSLSPNEARDAMLSRVHVAQRELAQVQELMLHRVGSREGWTAHPLYFIVIAAFWVTIGVVAFLFQAQIGGDLVALAIGLSAIQLVQVASDATYRDQDRAAVLPLFERLQEARRRLTLMTDHILHG